MLGGIFLGLDDAVEFHGIDNKLIGSSSSADSSAKVPIDSPGARIHVFATVSRFTIFCSMYILAHRRGGAWGTCTARRNDRVWWWL